MNIVERFIYKDTVLQRGSHHSAEKLCNPCCILRTAEGHHCFCSRAVPPGRKVFLKENNLYLLVFCDIRSLNMRDIQSVYGNRARLTEGVDNFIFGKTVVDSFLNFCKAVIEISIRNFIAATVFNLNYKYRMNLCIVLLIRILIPVNTLVLPFVGSCLKNRHIVVRCIIFGICNDNSVFQEPGRAYLGGGNFNLMNGCGFYSFNEPVKSCSCCTHSENNRHRAQLVRRTTF